MRKLLSAAAFAVLLSTAAFAAEPSAPEKGGTEAPTVRPADAKGIDTVGATDELVIPDGWSLVTSPVGGFRAAFPSSPKVKEQPLKTEAGWVRMISYGVAPKNDDSYLMVMVGQYPDGTMSAMPADQVLKSACDGMLAQQKLTLLTDKPVSVNAPKGSSERSFPGRDIEATQGPEGMRISIRMILVKDRMYQIMFMHKNEDTGLFKQLLSTFSLQ
ncbi:hypothetical protein NR798_10380 [Archangium gephyra]|uniref:hypothetical protein n=1 Tax=Archangium gephyra TaxID=48 RepID=UPI0035D3F7E5